MEKFFGQPRPKVRDDGLKSAFRRKPERRQDSEQKSVQFEIWAPPSTLSVPASTEISNPTINSCDESCPLRFLDGVFPIEDGARAQQRRPPSMSNAHQKPPYVYTPLQPWQTRLIRLMPLSVSGELSCRLVTVNLIDMPGVGIAETSEVVRYWALSYVWGASELDHGIDCEGQWLPISFSLAQALTHLARADRGYFWCDGICINQSDSNEKAEQVRRMLRIFEKADGVIAWVGVLDIFVEKALKLIMQQAGDDQWPTKAKEGRHGDICWEGFQIARDAIYRLLSAPFFSRIWVRQELFAATEVVITSMGLCVNFRDLRAQINLWFSLKTPKNRPNIFSGIWRLESSAETELSKHLSYHVLCGHLDHNGTDTPGYATPTHRTRYSMHWLNILQDGNSFHVTDDRDRVYGVLGITTSPTTRLHVEDRPDIRSSVFPIDYNKSVSQVYQDVVKYLINIDRSLDALTIFGDRCWQFNDLPSWVADWREDEMRFFLDVRLDTGMIRETCGFATLQDMDDYGRLALEGVQLGRVQILNGDLNPVDEITKSYRRHWSWSLDERPSVRDLQCRFLACRYVGGTFTCYSRGNDYRSQAYFPLTAMLGDSVVMLTGGRCPFVLRPLTKNTYTFVGPVILGGSGHLYTDGIGKPVSRTDPSEYEKFIIV